MPVLHPIGRYARSVGILRPVPGEGFEFREVGKKGTHERSSPSGPMRSRPRTGRFVFFATVIALAACMHEPMVNPGETLDEEGGEAIEEPRSLDTLDRSLVRADADMAPIFVQH